MAKRQGKELTPENKRKSFAYKSKTDPPQYLAHAKLDGHEPNEVIDHYGVEYERTDYVEVDFSSIPAHVRDKLVNPLIPLLTEFYDIPENYAKFEKWLADKKEKEASKSGHC